MIMEWNNRDYRFDSNGGNDRNFFQEHNECMRGFRRSHANVTMVNAPRRDQAAFIETMEPLRVRRARIETGGSQLLTTTTDWSVLVPIVRVARYKFSQN